MKKGQLRDFPGGRADKNPLANNAGDTGLILAPGRSYMSQSNQARVPQLLSLCSGDQGLRVLSPHAAK